jgi:trk system potassium uptake protein TrkA
MARSVYGVLYIAGLIIIQCGGFSQNFPCGCGGQSSRNYAHLIEEEMSMGDMMTLLKLVRGNYSLVEEKIPAGALAIGVAIKDLKLPEHCVIAGVIRKNEVIVPRGATVFEEGDEVLAVTVEGARQLGKFQLEHRIRRE